MIAVDTNVVVRLLVKDDAAQARRAHALFKREEVFIAPTVLLETEWVLRGAYHYAAAQIVAMLRALLGLPDVTTERPRAVAEALQACAGGLHFADALHLVLSAAVEGGSSTRMFYSFDTRLRQRARRQLPGCTTAAP